MTLAHDSKRVDFATYQPKHFLWSVSGKVATITLNRPARKNPLTFESYAELRDTFRELSYCDSVKTIVITGAGGNFCSGGDVHDIIAPLVNFQEVGNNAAVLDFARMTGDLVKAMRQCPQVIICAVQGVCVGAGAIIAMASDLRFGTANSKVAFLFVRVGLSGADMGACNILPRLIGAGRAAELLYTGRVMNGEEAERWGFFNRLCTAESILGTAQTMAAELAAGPTYAHSMTKRCIHQEWNMGIDAAIEAEAQAQSLCMLTRDFKRAYHAFVDKRAPNFEGN